jgi:drug/metabolite transporter (DMT)-like permease
VLGLAAALTWGAADFGGGLTSRRTAVLGVVLTTQLVGMFVAATLGVLRHEALPAPADLAWSVVSGTAGVVAISALYHGLAVGRMGVVAPVTGVLAATIPVVAGVVLQGLPPALVSAGIVLAIVAVVLVSRVKGEAGGRSGVEFGVVAGIALGVFNVTTAQISRGLVFGPLAIVRATEALVVIGVLLLTRPVWWPTRSLLPALAVVGVLDMLGNGCYIAAAQSGPLAVASVLSSLYPVSTVILAAAILRERVTRAHALGIALALAAIVLIAGGGAA